MNGLVSLGASEIRRRVAAREVSCEEVVRAHLDRIAAVEPAVDAFLLVATDRALDRARRLDASLATGAPAPPLAGVPVAIKDVLHVEGLVHGVRRQHAQRHLDEAHSSHARFLMFIRNEDCA